VQRELQQMVRGVRFRDVMIGAFFFFHAFASEHPLTMCVAALVYIASYISVCMQRVVMYISHANRRPFRAGLSGKMCSNGG